MRDFHSSTLLRVSTFNAALENPADETLPGTLAASLHSRTPLAENSGRAAYRRTPGRGHDLPTLPGALAPVVERLGRGAAALKDIAHWPGTSVERACRLLNALYLTGGLMVTRSHHAARQPPTSRSWAELLRLR